MRAQRVCRAAVVAAALSTTTSAGAQVKWAVAVEPGQAVPTAGLTLTPNTRLHEDSVAELTLTCRNGADCRGAKAEIVHTVGAAAPVRREIPARSKSPGSAVFMITAKTDILGSGGTTVLDISLDDAVLEHFTLEREGADAVSEDPPTLAQLLARDCRAEFALPGGRHYDSRRDVARFIVTPVGNVLRRPAATIDEDDSVRVDVLADTRLLPLLKVHRISEIRTIGTVRFIGQGTDLPTVVEQAGGRAVARTPRCALSEFTLRDFANGKGEVEIRALTGKSGADEMSEVVGTFDFNVNPLYSGALSLGAMRTELESPAFGVREEGSDTVIFVRNEEPGYRVKYLLMYTHFIWGKRDVEKLPSNPLHRINPSMGVVLDDIPNNWVGGLTMDLFEGVYLSGGAHFGRVKRLDPDAGLRVGDRFRGEKDDIPTQALWRVEPFFSVGVDVRAAAELLRMALTGSGSR